MTESKIVAAPAKPAKTIKPAKPAKRAKRSRIASTLLAGVLIAVAVTGVATLSAASSGTLQRVLELAGFGQGTPEEHEQQRQTATLAGLDAMVMTISSELGDLSRQQEIRGSQHDELLARIADLDREIGTLRERIAREGQQTAAKTTVEPDHTAQQKVITDLQASLQQGQTSLTEVTRRLTQLENTIARSEVTSSIAPAPAPAHAHAPAKRKVKTARSKPRVASAPAPAPVLSGAPISVVTTLD